MIIKRKLKSEMPSLKRRRLGDSEDDDSALGTWNKKKKKATEYFPINLLAGAISSSLCGILGASAATAAATAAAAAATATPENDFSAPLSGEHGVIGDGKNVSRPALVRTSRGRTRVLPSRFNDSVIENWRKDGKSATTSAASTAGATSFREYEFEELSLGSCGGKGKNVDRRIIGNQHRPRGYSVLCEEVLHKNFGVAASKGLTLREMYEESKGNKRKREEEKKKEGLYGPEDFSAGDIVWARARTEDPFWPAIVLDPKSQAPKLVLRSCTADSACVMFLGYSENQHERVNYIYTFITVN